MKRFAVMLLCLLAAPAFAQVTSNSTTDVQSGSLAGANNEGNSLTNNFGAADGVRYSGHYSVHANPGTTNGGAAAGFSSDNCGNTGQKSVSAMIASGATMYTIESVPCNLRSGARLGFAIADNYDAKGQPIVADNVRSMALLEWCKSLQESDVDALHNCEDRALITHGAGGTVKSPRPLTYERTPEIIPSRAAGWTNAQDVGKNKAPAAHDGQAPGEANK